MADVGGDALRPDATGAATRLHGSRASQLELTEQRQSAAIRDADKPGPSSGRGGSGKRAGHPMGRTGPVLGIGSRNDNGVSADRAACQAGPVGLGKPWEASRAPYLRTITFYRAGVERPGEQERREQPPSQKAIGKLWQTQNRQPLGASQDQPQRAVRVKRHTHGQCNEELSFFNHLQTGSGASFGQFLVYREIQENEINDGLETHLTSCLPAWH